MTRASAQVHLVPRACWRGTATGGCAAGLSERHRVSSSSWRSQKLGACVSLARRCGADAGDQPHGSGVRTATSSATGPARRPDRSQLCGRLTSHHGSRRSVHSRPAPGATLRARGPVRAISQLIADRCGVARRGPEALDILLSGSASAGAGRSSWPGARAGLQRRHRLSSVEFDVGVRLGQAPG